MRCIYVVCSNNIFLKAFFSRETFLALSAYFRVSQDLRLELGSSVRSPLCADLIYFLWQAGGLLLRFVKKFWTWLTGLIYVTSISHNHNISLAKNRVLHDPFFRICDPITILLSNMDLQSDPILSPSWEKDLQSDPFRSFSDPFSILFQFLSPISMGILSHKNCLK